MGPPWLWGTDMATVAGRPVDTNDLGVMGAGAAALLFSFLPYWGFSYSAKSLGGVSASITAWHGFAFLGLLLLFAAAGVGAARVFGGATLPELPVGWHVVVAGAAVLGA